MFFEDVCLQDWFDLVWAPEQVVFFFSRFGDMAWSSCKKAVIDAVPLPAVLHRFMQSNISPESTRKKKKQHE